MDRGMSAVRRTPVPTLLVLAVALLLGVALPAGPSWGRVRTSVTARRVTRSGTSRSGSNLSMPAATARSTTFISKIAKLAPRQRRTPPPNGIHVYVPAGCSKNRSGRNRKGSG